jgi:thiol-disulfide isomerase/thioredoxin
MHPKTVRRLFCLLTAALTITQTVRAQLKTGDSFPSLETFQLEGKPLPALQGKVVLVDFWASWCAPCKKSFPVMNALQQKYASEGLVIVAVNVDEAASDFENFVKKTPVAFATVRDAKQKLINRVDVHTMPTSFLCDRDGKVRFMHSGFEGESTRRQYETEIQSLLKR